jgi:hypothetical protein
MKTNQKGLTLFLELVVQRLITSSTYQTMSCDMKHLYAVLEYKIPSPSHGVVYGCTPECKLVVPYLERSKPLCIIASYLVARLVCWDIGRGDNLKH